MKTYAAKPADIKRQRYLVDAEGQTLGRLASRVAILLMGKHKPIVSPNADTGDFVVVINSDKVRYTGKKATLKIYYRHSGYPGGFRETSLERAMENDSTKVIQHAVDGMIPHTKLGDAMRTRLRVYPGAEHPFGAGVQKILLEDKK